ncbi:general stress protein [Streptomyces sp. NPDC060064]|uniref:general stress protein n=1 Tax=Streptomyces sp. NPDC060064 TaxID=3347049 RepID=UPI00369705BC
MQEQSTRPVASYATYAEAERAVDHLSDRGFPVEKVAIVGHDVHLVEQVVGRMDYGKAALQGAAAGAVPGALIGWIFGLLDWLDPVVAGLLLALYGLIFGAIVGALLGTLLYSLQGGRRDFASFSVMQPSRYEVVVEEDVADEAAHLIAGLREGASGGKAA